jgi:hypothetical protein
MMLLDDIANHLSSSVTELSIGYNLWKLPIPENASSSVRQVMISEYGGRPSLRAMGASLSEPVAEITRFNIAVFGGLTEFEETRQLAEDIKDALDYLSETTLSGSSGTRYLHVRALQPPISLPPDDQNGLHHFSINFEAMKVRG